MKARLPELQEMPITSEQQAVIDEIISGPRGSLNGPFRAWVLSPDFAKHAQRLGTVCRYESGLPTRLAELAVLVTAARWRSNAEWHIHHPIATQSGLPSRISESIRTGRKPDFDDLDDEMIYSFASELYDLKRVRDETFHRAVERFGLPVVVNLVGLLGYYACVAMTLNTFDIPADGQAVSAFSD